MPNLSTKIVRAQKILRRIIAQCSGRKPENFCNGSTTQVQAICFQTSIEPFSGYLKSKIGGKQLNFCLFLQPQMSWFSCPITVHFQISTKSLKTLLRIQQFSQQMTGSHSFSSYSFQSTAGLYSQLPMLKQSLQKILKIEDKTWVSINQLDLMQSEVSMLLLLKKNPRLNIILNQMSQELSEFQKFKLERMKKKIDDDNNSAHFSANYSVSNKSDCEVDARSYRSNADRESQLKLQAQLDAKNKQYDQLEQRYKHLVEAQAQTKLNLQKTQKEVQKYKLLYDKRIEKEKETKVKLKNWVKEAKSNLKG